MEQRRFKTRFLYDNLEDITSRRALAYINGVIQGSMNAICTDLGEFKTYGHSTGILDKTGNTIGTTFHVTTTEERYEKFREFVEYYYPGACEFDC